MAAHGYALPAACSQTCAASMGISQRRMSLSPTTSTLQQPLPRLHCPCGALLDTLPVLTKLVTIGAIWQVCA